jgi:cysteine desulfurase
MTSRIYLDHAATSPLLPAARAALEQGFSAWANPSSPHAEGRGARALIEQARGRIGVALDWTGSVIFTSGATEALGIALLRAKADGVFAGATEHESVLRHVPAERRLPVNAQGLVQLPAVIEAGTLFAIQQVNSETGVIQPLDALAETIHAAGGLLLADCCQGAGKLLLPQQADFIAISAHKLGGPIGIGALLVRDLTQLHPSGGQEQGYRGGTEAMPLALAFAAALEAPRDWLAQTGAMRAALDQAISKLGGEVVAVDALRLPAIGSYRMPGVNAQAQLIRFDMAGIAISAGSACSSGTLRPSTVLTAMGWNERAGAEVIRVSMGHSTVQQDIDAFLAQWQAMGPGTHNNDLS